MMEKQKLLDRMLCSTSNISPKKVIEYWEQTGIIPDCDEYISTSLVVIDMSYVPFMLMEVL